MSGGCLRPFREEEAARLAQWESSRPYPWNQDQFLEIIGFPHCRALVWEEDSQAQGFVVIQVVEEEVYIMNLMVSPGRQGEGVGRMILQEVLSMAQAEGRKEFFLDVDPSNKRACQLYRHLGFKDAQRRPSGYPTGEDIVTMRKTL